MRLSNIMFPHVDKLSNLYSLNAIKVPNFLAITFFRQTSLGTAMKYSTDWQEKGEN